LTSSRPSPFFLLGLIQDATHVISMLALLQEANAQDVIVWEHFIHIYILLLMLLQHPEKICSILSCIIGGCIIVQRSPFLRYLKSCIVWCM
jgi:hypothetical protein